MTKTFRDWGVHPLHFFADYESTHLRAPTQPLIALSAGLSERTGPLFHRDTINALDHDMIRNGQRGGEPIGERIMVSGKVLDERGQSIADTIIELWQANAAGLYADRDDQHDAPLDPNFFGAGRCITDKEGKYLFYSIKPGLILEEIRLILGARLISILPYADPPLAHGLSPRCIFLVIHHSLSIPSSWLFQRRHGIALLGHFHSPTRWHWGMNLISFSLGHNQPQWVSNL